MHLTGGQFKGRYISTPTGYENPVKPTLSKVRESVFNILNSYFASLSVNENISGNAFSDLSFLDMFAGSGIMALEAYSRGFKKVCAIEKQASVFSAVKKMYAEFGADISLFNGDSLKILNKIYKSSDVLGETYEAAAVNECCKFDVIYIDPPWDFDYTPIVETALEYIAKDGLVITECNKKGLKQAYQYKGMEILPFREKIYGRCKLDFIKLP